MPEAQSVNQFFSKIAPGYDLANRVMSSGIDVLWRRRLAAEVARTGPESLLDLATGSGDVAFTMARRVKSLRKIVGMDFCEPMLDQARKKQPRLDPSNRISFEAGDCLCLPCEDRSFDAVTISFGLRNLEDRAKGLAEMLRVIKPGGSLFVLEFTQPHPLIRLPYYAYLKSIIPTLSGTITGHRDAYRYLSSSIEAFPTRQDLAEEIQSAGFEKVRHKGLTFSIAAIHQGTRS
jgi:demethylmenaquinone methyltransferase/2-methoxy-6-polyprenyl-1,4-benzoquinol methylase